MKIKSLWILFGVTGGFFVAMNIVGLFGVAAMVMMMAIPPSWGWWLLPTGLILSILVVLGVWILFASLCVRWGKALETRALANPGKSRKGERSLLWVGVVVSACYLLVIGFYGAAGYISAKSHLIQSGHHAATDSTMAGKSR